MSRIFIAGTRCMQTNSSVKHEQEFPGHKHADSECKFQRPFVDIAHGDDEDE